MFNNGTYHNYRNLHKIFNFFENKRISFVLQGSYANYVNLRAALCCSINVFEFVDNSFFYSMPQTIHPVVNGNADVLLHRTTTI